MNGDVVLGCSRKILNERRLAFDPVDAHHPMTQRIRRMTRDDGIFGMLF